jgi:hypothetical protein
MFMYARLNHKAHDGNFICLQVSDLLMHVLLFNRSQGRSSTPDCYKLKGILFDLPSSWTNATLHSKAGARSWDPDLLASINSVQRRY